MDVQIDWRWVWVALGCVALRRDAGYVARLLILARGELTLKRATSSIVLWELASALTLFCGRRQCSGLVHPPPQRLELGAGSLATVMSTALLDELYFLLAVLSSHWRSVWPRFCPNRRPGLKARWPPFSPSGTPSWRRWPRF